MKLFAYVNHAQILLKETTGAYDGARTPNWQVPTVSESAALPTALHCPWVVKLELISLWTVPLTLCLCYRVLASKYGLDKIAEKMKEYEISGLVIVGGFEVNWT